MSDNGATILNTQPKMPGGTVPEPGCLRAPGPPQAALPGRPRYERITQWLTYLVDPGTVVELRAPEVDFGNGFKATVSGFYDSDHLLDMAIEAVNLTEAAPGVYYTINPLDPELLALRTNRAEKRPRRTAKDADVIRRTRLLVDLDPVRYSQTTGKPLTGDISATNEEKARARATAERVRGDLEVAGWPGPVLVDSGNGCYLLYKVDLPTDDGGLIERCLKALAAQYDDARVHIDQRVFNPSRIMKIPGTSARKGDSTTARPHRQSSVVSVPEVWSCVPTERLEALAAQAPSVPPHPSKKHHQPATTSNPMSHSGCEPVRTGKYDHIVTNTKLATTAPKASVADRCRAYLEKVPPSISGDHGHNRLFHATMIIVDRFGIEDEDTAYELLSEFNEKEGGDPEDERQLRHKLADAFKKVEAQGGPSRDLVGNTTDENEYCEEGTNDEDDPTSGLKLPVTNPKRMAQLVLQRKYHHADHPTILYWRDTWWIWRRAQWECLNADTEIRNAITLVAEREFELLWHKQLAAFYKNNPDPKPEDAPSLKPVTQSFIANVMGSLQAHNRLEAAEQPCWVGEAPAPFPSNLTVPTRTALVNIMSGTHVDITPRFFSPYRLDFDYQPDAPEPAEWLKFLRSVYDADAIMALQEWFGYCITHDVSQHKILLLIGKPRSGKGVTARILARLMGGYTNTDWPTLASLKENFGLQSLIGKPLAIFGDVRLDQYMEQRSVIVERLLTISGGDSITIPRKHIPAWVGALPTRFMLISNEIPWLPDASTAFASRIIAIRTTQSFLGREDIELESRLVRELPGIFNWAIAGWKRLRERGHLIQPASGLATALALREQSSKISTFVAEVLEVDPQLDAIPEGTSTYREPQEYVRHAWEIWCLVNGHTKSGSKSTISITHDLDAVLPKVTADKTTKIAGAMSIDLAQKLGPKVTPPKQKSVRLYTGVRLNEEYRHYVEATIQHLWQVGRLPSIEALTTLPPPSLYKEAETTE